MHQHAGWATLIARYASDQELDQWFFWVQPRIAATCRITRSPADENLLADQAKLLHDPQMYGAEGLAALISRGRSTTEDKTLAIELATHRLQDVAAGIIHTIDWKAVPDFAWRATVAAFDMCVLRRNRSG